MIERIDKPTADKFLKINHLQGSVKAKFKYGLFLKPQYVERFFGIVVCGDTDNGIQSPQPKLIAVATFSGARTMKIGERAGTRSFELIRFATLQNYVVVGGMDKLLKALIKDWMYLMYLMLPVLKILRSSSFVSSFIEKRS